MGNRAAIIPLVCAVALFGATLLYSPAPAAAASRGNSDSVLDALRQRLCDRQEKIGGRISLIPAGLCGQTPPTKPTVVLTANPTTITTGQSATLTWSSTNATSCTAFVGWTGSKPANGSAVVSPTQTTTYQLDCTGPGGTGSDDAVVTVTVVQPDAPTLDFSASPTDIVSGATSTLTWAATNATSCTASDGWSGAKSLSGNQAVTPNATTTYTLTCTGAGGNVAKSVTVNVTPNAPQEPTPTLTFSASRTTVHENSASDATTTLTWDSTDATSCAASGAAEWTGSKAVDGSLTVTPTADVTYALDCSGAGGNVHKEVAVDFVPEEAPSPTLDHAVISEVLYDAASTTVGSENFNEWVEIYNGTNSAIDFQGWMIGDAVATDTISTSFVVPSHGFGVIAASTTPAGIPGGVPVYVLFSSIGSNGFTNTGEGARLFNAGGILVDQVGYGTGTITPVVSIPTEHDGHSIHRIQLTSDNDSAADWEDTGSPTPGQ